MYDAVCSLHDSGFMVTVDTICRQRNMKPRDVVKALSSLRKQGMIARRNWGGGDGTYVPARMREDQ